MASFEELPVEIKESIVLETTFHDLISLSKTCKSIRAVALPAMFRNIDFTWDANSKDGPPITALLRSIYNNIHFQRSIQTLTLKAINYRGYQEPGFEGDVLLPCHTHRIPTEDWEIFEKALQVCPCEGKFECDDPTTREGNLNAAIAVLIRHCTRIRSLHVDVHFFMHTYRLSSMFRSTISRVVGPWGKQAWFSNLNHVTVSHTPNYYHTRLPPVNERYAVDLPVQPNTFLKMFYLPAVKTLDLVFFPNINNIEDSQDVTLKHTVWPFPQVPVASTLTKLQLRRSPALPETLDLLLSTTPNLQSLDYDLFIPANQAPLSLDTLRKALDHIRTTIKHLSVKWEIFHDPDDYFGGVNVSPFGIELTMACIGALGSLREFPALLTLETSLAVLYGQEQETRETALSEILPPNLERFTLLDDLWEFETFNWSDLEVLQILRKFLTGDKKHKEWFNEERKKYEVNWTVDSEPGWKSATPRLSEMIVDFRRRGWSSSEFQYLSCPAQRIALQKLCQDQGMKFDFRKKCFPSSV